MYRRTWIAALVMVCLGIGPATFAEDPPEEKKAKHTKHEVTFHVTFENITLKRAFALEQEIQEALPGMDVLDVQMRSSSALYFREKEEPGGFVLRSGQA